MLIARNPVVMSATNFEEGNSEENKLKVKNMAVRNIPY